ncbi:relaxase/mobilization nuclease domain-containing protein, partial [Agrobacterium tumefaciens]
MATDDMHTALRVMVATAKQADELKARAGVKNTGKKSTKVVQTYSLSWHPDEAATLTRDEMVRAADASLKVLGAENRQAVIVCHTDQEHPHVHVILNRVDPEDGRMLTTNNNFYKLSDWANQYERERGRVLTPRREEKRQQREQNADKAKRREYTEQKRAAAKEQAHDPKTRAALLRELGASQKVQHRDQWRDLATREKADRNEIYRLSGVAIAATIEQHKAECKPIWAEHYRGKRAAERRFNQREKSMSGVVVNAFVAARHQQASGQLEGRGLFSATVANVFSSRARQQAFEQAQEMTRQQLASRLKSIVDNEISNLKEQRGRDLAKHRDLFKAERSALID